MTTPVVDVHAHWLPRELFALPPGVPFGGLRDVDGELHLGDVPLSIRATAMSDVDAVRDDMAAAGIDVRVLSAPPFAFPVGTEGAADYVAAFNAALAEVVTGPASDDRRLLGLGLVDLADADARRIRREVGALAATDGIVGVAIPPVLAGTSLDTGVLRAVLAAAAETELAVLVHPMQLPRPEWGGHYLANLVGNPTETATAVAAVLLGGVIEEYPTLRVCFVHGGGCAPGLLGRWDHGWRTRADVRRHSTRPPSEGFRQVFFDTVTHGGEQLRLLGALAGPDRLVCGSDYPFDMAQDQPVRFATDHGISATALGTAGAAFLPRVHDQAKPRKAVLR